MDTDTFLSTPIDEITPSDIENAFFMIKAISDEEYRINYIWLDTRLEDNIDKTENTFSLYKNEKLLEQVNKLKRSVGFIGTYETPFYFNMQFGVNVIGEVIPLITVPKKFDQASYPFLGHEFHHALNDIYPEERKLSDRVAEVIPLFYELLCAEKEDNIDVSKEILKRRIMLLTMDKLNIEDCSPRKLQYFNSYYYALGLFDLYKRNPILVFRLVARVLQGEINTLGLLKLLNLYESNLDNKVIDKVNYIKEYIRKQYIFFYFTYNNIKLAL